MRSILRVLALACLFTSVFNAHAQTLTITGGGAATAVGTPSSNGSGTNLVDLNTAFTCTGANPTDGVSVTAYSGTTAGPVLGAGTGTGSATVTAQFPPGQNAVQCKDQNTLLGFFVQTAADGNKSYVYASNIIAPDSTPFNGTACFTPMNAYNQATPYNMNGQATVRGVASCRPVTNGVISVAQPLLLLPRSNMTHPAGVNYQVSLIDKATNQKQVYGTFAITGDTWDLDSAGPTNVQTAPPAAWLAPQFTIGSVATGTPGSPAQVSVGGTLQNPTFNFSIPAGINGATGAQGVQGNSITGPQGATGAQGPVGAPAYNFLGAYSPTTPYTNGSQVDVVTYKGSSYAALKSSINVAPDTDSTSWVMIAQKGDPGPAGAGTSAGAAQSIQLSNGTGNSTVADDYVQVLADHTITSLGPRIDVRDPMFSTNCPNGADPSGKLPSDCAINAAIKYSYTHAQSQSGNSTGSGEYLPVYFPCGLYTLSNTVYDPNGVSLLGDGKTCVVLKNINPTSAGVDYYSGYDMGTFGTNLYLNYTIIQGISFAGNDHLTTGPLLEIDVSYLILRDAEFYNNGGRGIQWNNAERVILENPSFYTVRQAIEIAGDANESTIIDMHGVGVGQTQSGFCYDVNCDPATGQFPAAGTTANPTVLKMNTHQAVDDYKSVNLRIIGGDMKDNHYIGGFRFDKTVDTYMDSTYMEASLYSADPRMQNSIVFGGVPQKTGLASGSGMGVGSSNGTTYYTFGTTDNAWMTQVFNNLNDLVATNPGADYQPYVLIPGDFSHTDSSPSAACPGLNKNEYEQSNAAIFYGYGSNSRVSLWSRNVNGVYNQASNPTGAPQNYDWSQCSSAYIEDGFPANNSPGIVRLANIHSETIQGQPTQSGYTYDTSHQGSGPTAAEFLSGVVPGYGTDFYTQFGATGSPNSYPQLQQSIIWDAPDNIFDGSNPFQGQIAVVGNTSLEFYGGEIAADANVSDPFALTPDTDGSEHISLANSWGSAKEVRLYPGANGSNPSAEVKIPAIGFYWNSRIKAYQAQRAYSVSGQGYFYGTAFSSDWRIFDVASSTAGTTYPTFQMHCVGMPNSTNPGCDFQNALGTTNNGWQTPFFSAHVNGITSGVLHTFNGGIQNKWSVTTGSITLTPANRITSVAASGAVTITLPACTNATTGIDYWVDNASTSATVSVVTSGGQNIYGASGANFTTFQMTTQGAVHLFCENGSQYRILDVPPGVGTATITGFGTGVTGTVTGNNLFGNITLNIPSGAGANATLATIAVTAGWLNPPSGCTLEPQNGAASALGWNVYSTKPTGTSFSIASGPGFTSTAASSPQWSYSCSH